jgi:hypothetical protein
MYRTNLLGPYVAGQVTVYRCPSDTIPSDNGVRIRSISMNAFMGVTKPLLLYGSSGWTQYQKNSQLTKLKPVDAWIFCDENMANLNDGFMQMNLNQPIFPDVPAAYDGAGTGNSFSFADGHAEKHKWQGKGFPSPNGILNWHKEKYKYGVKTGNCPTYTTDKDWLWFKLHSSNQ